MGQSGVMTGCRLGSIRFEMRCVCQIGVMMGYRLESIKFELRWVLDWSDDRLQAGQYKA